MKIYEILLGIIMLGLTQLSQIPADIEINDVVVESDCSDTEVGDTATESDYSDTEIGDIVAEPDDTDMSVSNAATEEDYSDRVSIERRDESVYDEEGRLIAQIYYDKPVIRGDSEAIKKINAYFDNEANAFYNQGTSVTWFSADAFQQFKDGLELMKERWGNEIMAEYPTRYAMDTSVCYMDENIISIVQVRNYMLEHNSWHCYGSTFDLRTGELIPITKLISIKPEEMKTIFLITGNIIDIGVYEVLKDDNYVIDDCGHRIDMKYEYFYDGESYYLINEFALEFRTSLVIKWNGKWGENLEVTEFYYYTDRITGQIACREPGMS
mgnify:CR=1 FL=1